MLTSGYTYVGNANLQETLLGGPTGMEKHGNEWQDGSRKLPFKS
jgi:hypothetical protein